MVETGIKRANLNLTNRALMKRLLIIKFLFILFFNCNVSQNEQTNRVSQLIQQSDFIGLVMGYPLIDNRGSEWEQIISIGKIESLKGTIGFLLNTKQYLSILAGNDNNFGYPTWFYHDVANKYLVFLKKENERFFQSFAVFPVEYRPNKNNQIIGRIISHPNSKIGLDVNKVIKCLTGLINTNAKTIEYENAINLFLRKASKVINNSSCQKPIPFNKRFKEANEIVKLIKIGTERKDIERIFPFGDGGLHFPCQGRYYFGSEVMIAVPFDGTGGNWKPTNKVNGQIKVYRAHMALD